MCKVGRDGNGSGSDQQDQHDGDQNSDQVGRFLFWLSRRWFGCRLGPWLVV